MSAVPVLATLIVLAFAALGTMKILAVPAMVGRAEHLGFTARSYRYLGVLEVLGAVGLALGVVLPWLGIAAAVGLLLMMAGAIAAHLRGGDRGRELVPAVAVRAPARSRFIPILPRPRGSPIALDRSVSPRGVPK